MSEARVSLTRALGSQAVLSIDPHLGTPRIVARLDGTLTGPSSLAPARVALGFIRANRTAFGLTLDDLRTLAAPRDYVDVLGTHHISWTQEVDGIPVFEAGVRAAVTADGRLVTVTGPTAHAPVPNTTSPRLSAAAARTAAYTAAGAAASAGTPMDQAKLVLFPSSQGTRLAWQTITLASVAEMDLSVVDAVTGRVLYRRNLTQADVSGQGLAWGYTPSQTVPNGGGTQQSVTFPVLDATALSGNNAHVFTDASGKEIGPQPRDEIPASDPTTLDWSYPAFLNSTRVGQNCTADWECTWNSRIAYSWRENRRQSATQTYWFLNHFHDWLQAPPIGFTEAAGNFQLVNDDGQGGLGNDPVLAASMLTAAADDGFPAWTNNAFMGTPPDGQSPFMGLLLFEKADLGPEFPVGSGIPSSDAGQDGSVVYHEYTHGLSDRLVVYPGGTSALDSYQAYSMGEAWSDWYALDLLVGEGYIPDTAAPDVVEGRYITGGPGIRTEPIDCRVDSSTADCPGPLGGAAGPGGYTYGDMSQIGSYAEPHADGEIWAQTLWDIRGALGPDTAEMLVTRAMELSPPGPSFLDMRNAILQADGIAFGGADVDTLWRVFAARGMGFFAESLYDEFPWDWGSVTEDFSLPVTCPGDPGCGRLQGQIIENITREPIAGATVWIAGSASGLPIDLSATTGPDGTYTIADVPSHVYPQVVVSAHGYYPVRTFSDVRVAGTSVLDATLDRDWASTEGGAQIVRVTGMERGECDAAKAFDMDLDTAWWSRLPRHGPRPSVVLQLPQAVDVRSFAVEPTAPCSGLDFSWTRKGALGRFWILTRTATGPWVLAFLGERNLPLHRLSSLHPQRGAEGVVDVKLVLRSNRSRSPRVRLVTVEELMVRGTPAA